MSSLVANRIFEVERRAGGLRLVRHLADVLPVAPDFIARQRPRITVLHVRQKEAYAPISDLPAWIPATISRECTIECVTREGEPADAIVALAHELRTDMLVIGTQHRLFHGASVIGATTAMVVRHAPCPVLTVIGPPVGGL